MHAPDPNSTVPIWDVTELLETGVEASADVARQRIEDAGGKLRAGGLIAFPTETVYGLGANGLSPEAVRRVFEAKGRPSWNPVILHVASAEEVRSLCARELTEVERSLTDAFWPGPLTLVLPRSERVPAVVAAGGDTVAVRCPNHPVALGLIRAAGVPIAAPSANRFMAISPTRAAHVVDSLSDGVDLVLDGGPCEVGLESTVVRVDGASVTILREGGVSREQLIEAGYHVERGGSAPAARVESPGTHHKHYAPTAKLIVLDGVGTATGARAQAYIAEDTLYFASDEDLNALSALGVSRERLLRAGSRDDLSVYARRLYALLREADSRSPRVIVGIAPPPEGMGSAIRDRLRRASSEWVVQ